MSSGRPLPEFFLDRCLGRATGSRLRALGWLVHDVHDYFPNDAAEVPDEEWIAFGIARGWVCLTKDKRIRYRAAELGALVTGHIVCLSNGQLKVAEAVDRFQLAQDAIARQTSHHEVGFWHLGEGGRLTKKWP